MSKETALRLLEAKIKGDKPSRSRIVSEAARIIREEREKVDYLQKVLHDISNTPKVRGIGSLENSLNGVITKAEQAIEHFND